MRRQDEILILYPRAPVEGRRFLLAQAEEVSLQFDHPRVLSFLQEESRSPDLWIAHLAQVCRTSLQVEAEGRTFGFRASSRGTRSDHHRDGGVLDASATVKSHCARLQKAALRVLAPVVEPLTRLAAPGESLAPEAIRCLGRIPLPASLKHLAELVRFSDTAPLALSTLGRSGSHRAMRTATESLASLSRPGPTVLAVMRYLPWEWRVRALTEALERTPNDCMGVALAAAGVRGEPGLELAGRLLSHADPWVRTHALRSLALQAQGFHLSRAAFEREEEVLLRTWAIQAMLHSGEPETAEYLLGVLGAAPEPLQAAIIEGLKLLGAGGSALVSRLAGFLQSPHPRVRSAAIVYLVRDDPAAVLEPIAQLLASHDASSRRAGVFCLGYVVKEPVARKLLEFVQSDRAPDVAYMALVSLARLPLKEAREALVAATAHADEGVRQAALWALSECDPGGAADLVARVRKNLPPAEGSRLPFLSMVGRLAASGGDPALAELLAGELGAPDPAAVTAALEGLILAGVASDTSQIVDVRRSRETLAPVLLWRLLAGDLAAAEEFVPLLSGSDPGPALRCLERFLGVLGYVGSSRRFEALESGLLAHIGDRAGRSEADDAAALDTMELGPAPKDPDSVPDGRRVAAVPSAPDLAQVLADRLGPIRPSPERSSALPRYTSQVAMYRMKEPTAGLAKPVGFVALLIVLLGSVHFALRPGRSPEVKASPAAVPVRPEGLTVLRCLALPGEETAHFAGQLLSAGAAFKTQGLLVMATRFPSSTLVAHPGAGTVIEVNPEPPPASGQRVRVQLSAGEYLIDFRPGASAIAIDLPWGSILGQMARFELSCRSAGAEIRLESGKVEVRPKSGSPVSLRGPASWVGP